MEDSSEAFDKNVTAGKVGLTLQNKKKYEEEIQTLSSAIKERETQFKSVNLRPEEKLQQELTSLLRDKEAQGQRRQSTDSDLKRVSQEITKQETELSKIQSRLIYRDDEKLNTAIKRLENELTTRNLKLQEERKFVAEIDTLRRSKKDLVVFQALKKQIDEKRDQQRRLRGDRDRSYKEEKRLQQRHSDVRREASKNREQGDALHSEIIELRGKLKTVQLEYNEYCNTIKTFKTFSEFIEIIELRGKLKTVQLEYNEYQEAQREVRRHAVLVSREKQQQQFRERTGSTAAHEPKKTLLEESKATMSLAEYRGTEGQYDDVMNNCAMLIKYLQRFLNQMNGSEEGGAFGDVTGANQLYKSDSQSGSEYGGKTGGGASIETDEEVAVLERSLEAEGMHVLKRKPSGSEVDLLPSCRYSKSSRRKKKPQLKKTLSHAPEIFAQFSRLGLAPPVSVTDVINSIHELQTKMQDHQLQLLDQGACGTQSNAATSFCSDVESRDESAIGGPSCPVTPEMSGLVPLPLLPPDENHRWRLSPDSGTGELDEVLGDCDPSGSSGQGRARIRSDPCDVPGKDEPKKDPREHSSLPAQILCGQKIENQEKVKNCGCNESIENTCDKADGKLNAIRDKMSENSAESNAQIDESKINLRNSQVSADADNSDTKRHDMSSKDMIKHDLGDVDKSLDNIVEDVENLTDNIGPIVSEPIVSEPVVSEVIVTDQSLPVDSLCNNALEDGADDVPIDYISSSCESNTARFENLIQSTP